MRQTKNNLQNTHNELIVRCECCGRELSRNGINDYGELCNRCYNMYNESEQKRRW